MAFNENLADKIRLALEHVPNATEKFMFGGICFMVDDKMCMGVVKDEMMCRIDPKIYLQALEKKGCREMVFTGKPMNGYVYVSEEGEVVCDYLNPKKIETRLRNIANRRTSWVKKQWKKSKNGNHYLKHEGRLLLIYKDNKTTKYKVAIANIFGHKTFDDFNKAKVAVFNGIEYLKENGRW